MKAEAIVILLVVWLSSLVGVGFWQNDSGHVAEKAVWQDRDNTALILANAKIRSNEENARRDEQMHAAELATISGNYQEEIKHEKSKTADLIRMARAGDIRLRDHKAAGVPAIGSGATETSPGPSGRDGKTGAELSGEAAEFLLALTGEANDVTRQLAACQAVVTSDRAQ